MQREELKHHSLLIGLVAAVLLFQTEASSLFVLLELHLLNNPEVEDARIQLLENLGQALSLYTDQLS
ncbi:hypothetical protein HMPREF3192_00696, partial [Atopobium deltae]